MLEDPRSPPPLARVSLAWKKIVSIEAGGRLKHFGFEHEYHQRFEKESRAMA